MRFLIEHGIADQQDNIAKPTYLFVEAGTTASALVIGILTVLCEESNHDDILGKIRATCDNHNLEANNLPPNLRSTALQNLGGCFDLLNKTIDFDSGYAHWDVPGATSMDADRMYVVSVKGPHDSPAAQALKAKSMRRAIRESPIRL